MPDRRVNRPPSEPSPRSRCWPPALLGLTPLVSSAQESAVAATAASAPAPDSPLLERIRAAAAAGGAGARGAHPRLPVAGMPRVPEAQLGQGRARHARHQRRRSTSINLAFRPDSREEFKVTPKTWWSNLKYGYIFDDNQFPVNQFGHPYQGGMYFNAGRANGLNYWESAMMSAMGSFTWECCGETNRGSINDFYSTTMGGMVLGEVFHRMAGLVRDNMATSGRTKKELLATAIDPIGGTVRAVNGEWGKVKPNPAGPAPGLPGRLGAGGRDLARRGRDARRGQGLPVPRTRLRLRQPDYVAVEEAVRRVPGPVRAGRRQGVLGVQRERAAVGQAAEGHADLRDAPPDQPGIPLRVEPRVRPRRAVGRGQRGVLEVPRQPDVPAAERLGLLPAARRDLRGARRRQRAHLRLRSGSGRVGAAGRSGTGTRPCSASSTTRRTSTRSTGPAPTTSSRCSRGASPGR